MLHETPGGFFGASVDYNRFNAIDGPVIPAAPPRRTPTIRPRNVPRADQLLVAGRGGGPTRVCSSSSTNAFAPLPVHSCPTHCRAARACSDVTQNLERLLRDVWPGSSAAQPRGLSGTVESALGGFQIVLAVGILEPLCRWRRPSTASTTPARTSPSTATRRSSGSSARDTRLPEQRRSPDPRDQYNSKYAGTSDARR